MKKHEQNIGSGEVRRFDQRNTMFSRPQDPERSNPEVLAMGKKHYGVRNFKDDEGYALLDWAFAMGSWYLERWWGFGNMAGNEGLYKWYINPEKCFQFWVRNKGDCANCIRVCVFNKPDTRFHSLVRWHVKNLPRFDSFYLWTDDLLGHGKRMKMEAVWK